MTTDKVFSIVLISSMNLRFKSFTLIETLLTIGLITFLASIVIIAINPARQFAQARNAERQEDVTTILNAIYQNMAENGEWSCPVAIPTTTSTLSHSDCDICDCLVPTYIAEMPVDPVDGYYVDCNHYNTHYEIVKDPNTKRITVSAPDAELGKTISATR